VLNELSTSAWRRMGSGSIDSHFLDLGASWGWVVSFTPCLLYLRERPPGTHWLGSFMDPTAGLPGFEIWPLSCSAGSLSLYRLFCPGSYYCIYFSFIQFKNHCTGGSKWNFTYAFRILRLLVCVKHNSFLWLILKVILFNEIYKIFWIVWTALIKN
jgi:hypothetical protein